MSSLDIGEMEKFKEPIKFTEKLETLQSQLPPILDDFKKYYVFFNKNPEFDEYEQMFQNVKGNLNKINSELFLLSNEVQVNINFLNKHFLQLDILIKDAKEKNKKLKKKLNIVEHKGNAATEMIDDYREIYETRYLRNWGLLLSTGIVLITISKLLKKP
jgi:hypothetical protein